MIYSMTGYANRTLHLENLTLQIDIRSVNHRFLELIIKSPEEFKGFDSQIRDRVTTKIKRGKIDLKIQIKNQNDANSFLAINPHTLNNYINLSKQIKQSVTDLAPSTIAQILKIPGMLILPELDINLIENPLLAEVDLLLEELTINQNNEGKKLQQIFEANLQQMSNSVTKAFTILPDIAENYKSKLRQRLIEAIDNSQIDEQRFTQEFAYFCQKIDVAEELNRLKTHIEQFQTLLNQGDMLGKKLDFLSQEMLREANTFGAKSAALNTTEIALTFKVLIEQIKEQIQNVR